jgi:hypothetical protein
MWKLVIFPLAESLHQIINQPCDRLRTFRFCKHSMRLPTFEFSVADGRCILSNHSFTWPGHWHSAIRSAASAIISLAKPALPVMPDSVTGKHNAGTHKQSMSVREARLILRTRSAVAWLVAATSGEGFEREKHQAVCSNMYFGNPRPGTSNVCPARIFNLHTDEREQCNEYT